MNLAISIDGLPVEAAWWGPGPDAAPTIVMLHEGLGCVALWRDVPARLAELTGCGVLAYSRFGYGASAPVRLPRPLTYMHDEAMNVLGQVLDQAGVKIAILLGHSDGGSIASIYVGGVQDFRVRGAVLIAAHFLVEDVSISSIRAAKAAYETTDLPDKMRRYHKDPDNAFWGWNQAWLDPAFVDWRIDDYVSTIRVPVLLVQGSKDEYGTLAQFAAFQAAAYCPVVPHVIEGAGHAPHLTHKDETLAVITAFVSRIMRLEQVGPPQMQNTA
jgi:pimeloyl-ACP methyl ester carboxylesterase